ncbi:MAG TPA: hypothetical protein VK599_09385 [Streptosporangiaceae bacterium]|jgi:hypothetical protein|nr:hypothetical protein [Streptosporangiaceae bacterium]
MSNIEDRLRAELWAQAQRTQEEDLRELRVPPRPAPAPAAARRRWWLAPAGAALAVTAVVGVLVGVRGTSGQQPPPAAAASQPPPFYVTVPDTGNSGHPDATVRATATGATLGRVSVPGTHFGYVAAAADDRTFVLAAYRPPTGTGGNRHGSTEFYRLTLSASGRPEPLARLPLTVQEGQWDDEPTSLALSADGTTLAVAVVPAEVAPLSDDPTSRIEVVSLRTGQARTWTVPRTDIESLSWVRGGTLAYLVTGTSTGGYGLRFLDTSGPAGGLTRDSRPVLLRGVTGQLLSALVTGHGHVVMAWTQAPGRAGQVGDAVLAEFSAQTGRRVRVLDTLPGRGAFESYARVWSADPSGDHVLAGGNTASGQVTKGGIVKGLVMRSVLDRIDRGRVTALPDPGNLTLAAAW